MRTVKNRAGRRRRVRGAIAVAAVPIVGVLAGCAPASGLPDARQFNVPDCSFEVRVVTTGPVPSVDVRRDGLEPPFVADPERDCGTHPGLDLYLGDGSSQWSCDSYGEAVGTPGVTGKCYSYSAGLVGGTWYGASAPGTLQSADVVWIDAFDAIHRIQVYP